MKPITSEVGAANQPLKKNKHLELDDAILYLEQTASIVNGLIGEILNSPEDNTPMPVHTEPSLCEVLDSSPTSIMDQCDRIRGSLAEIRTLIF